MSSCCLRFVHGDGNFGGLYKYAKLNLLLYLTHIFAYSVPFIAFPNPKIIAMQFIL
jgi:hypothetical protein